MFTNYIYVIENSFSDGHNEYMVTNSYVNMKSLVHTNLLHSLSHHWKDLDFETCKTILKDFTRGLKSTEKTDKKVAFHIQDTNRNAWQICTIYNRIIDADTLLQEVYLCILTRQGHVQELHVVETIEEARNINTTIYENNYDSHKNSPMDLVDMQRKTYFYHEFFDKNNEILSLSINKQNIVTFYSPTDIVKM